MKVGDLVEYISGDYYEIQSIDCSLGIVTRVMALGDEGWAKVIWSLSSGPYLDDVPLSALKVLS